MFKFNVNSKSLKMPIRHFAKKWTNYHTQSSSLTYSFNYEVPDWTYALLDWKRHGIMQRVLTCISWRPILIENHNHGYWLTSKSLGNHFSILWLYIKLQDLICYTIIIFDLLIQLPCTRLNLCTTGLEESRDSEETANLHIMTTDLDRKS